MQWATVLQAQLIRLVEEVEPGPSLHPLLFWGSSENCTTQETYEAVLGPGKINLGIIHHQSFNTIGF